MYILSQMYLIANFKIMTSGLYLVEHVNLEDLNYNPILLFQTILKYLLIKKIIILGFPENLPIVFPSQLII